MIISIKVPFKTEYNSKRKQIPLVKGVENSSLKHAPNKVLLKALVKAYYWQNLLDQGKFNTAGGISKKYRTNIADVSRILQLNLLSPKIKLAILNGTQPKTMNMQCLKKPFPDIWQEQLVHFAFER